jgi:hypothetical protein
MALTLFEIKVLSSHLLTHIMGRQPMASVRYIILVGEDGRQTFHELDERGRLKRSPRTARRGRPLSIRATTAVQEPVVEDFESMEFTLPNSASIVDAPGFAFEDIGAEWFREWTDSF